MERGRPPSGAYIKRWRVKLGLTHADIARELGVHPVTVRLWEKKEALDQVVKLAFDRVYR